MKDHIIRKTDFVNWNGTDPYRHGGVVTLVLELDENRRRMKLGFSFCSPADQFIKKTGVHMANQRLQECPIEVPVLYGADFMAGEVLKALCLRDWPTLEQVTTLEIHTEAWKKAVPGWAKKWYKQVFAREEQDAFQAVGEALAGWGDEILERATRFARTRVSKDMADLTRATIEMRDSVKHMMARMETACSCPGIGGGQNESAASKPH